jgi:hypothetical protein
MISLTLSRRVDVNHELDAIDYKRSSHKFPCIFTAVKFGRMSKKQREKVEDEVRFHRAQMRAASETAPDSSMFEQQQPSSSDQLPSYSSGG